MDNSFQTSFIPKKPITSSSGGGNVSRPSTSIFTVLSFFILIVVGASSVGLFLYKNYLIKQKETLSLSLEKVRDSFEQDTIEELELYDKRVSASRQVLGGHIVLSPMFELIGNLTIPSIQYTKFDHQTNSQGFLVKMSGVAVDYRSIALQADVFNTAKGRYFKNVVFSNLTKDKNSKINFDVEFNVDPTLLSYEKNLNLEQIQAKAQTPTPPINTNINIESTSIIPAPEVPASVVVPTTETIPNNNQTQ